MNFYFNRNNVEQYKAMLEGYDNQPVIDMLRQVLPEGADLLELGMGTGADLLKLAAFYHVTGSDFSPLFVEDFSAAHPEMDVLCLDAREFDLDRSFDCIYSNKVLYHLSAEEMKHSLCVQAEHLNKGGILFFTLWYGNTSEQGEEGLLFTYYTEESLSEVIPDSLAAERIIRYAEMEEGDSLAVILRKR